MCMGRASLSDIRRAVSGLLIAIAWASPLASGQAPSVEWERLFPDPGQGALSFQQMKDGSYRIVGNRAASTEGAFVLALGASGATLWERALVGKGAMYLAVTSDGGCAVAGAVVGPTENSTDALLLKLDALGNSQWQRVIDVGIGEQDHAIFADQRPEGGFVLVGTSRSNAEPYPSSIFVVGTDAHGEPIWQCSYSGMNRARALSARRTSDGGYIIAGATESAAYGWEDTLYVLKVSSGGQRVWERYFPEIRYHVGAAVGATRDGGSAVAVFANRVDGGGTAGALLLRMDGSGNVVWRKAFFDYGDPGYLYHFLSVMETGDGGLVVGGTKILVRSVEPRWTSCGCLVRTNAQGEILWEWLSRCGSYNPPDVRYSMVVGGSTADGGFLALVNRLADDCTGLRSQGFDVVKLRGTTPQTGRVTGRVTDASAGQGIGGVALLLDPDPFNYCPITDSTGHFSFDAPAGTYNLTASAEGYQSQTRTGVTVRAGQTTTVNFVLVPLAEKGFWVEVAHPNASGVTIYTSYTTSSEAIVSVPNGWVLLVVDTHGDVKQADGLVWWEVADSTWPAGISGWVPKHHLVRGDSTQPAEKATYLDSSEARREAFLAAVLRYYFNEDTVRSLYSGSDLVHSGHPANKFRVLRTGGFPIELIMAIALHESAADYQFDNRIYDQKFGQEGKRMIAGVGIMQIHGGVFPCSGCNKGWGSGLQNFRAYNAGAYLDGGVYRHDYYGNTRQGIHANVKDAFRVLQYAWDVTGSVLLAVNRYNTGSTYPAKVGRRLLELEVYFPGYEARLKAVGYTPLTTGELHTLASSLGQYVHVQMKSAASPQVWDSLGRVTGLVEGVERNEIPNSRYSDGIVILFERALAYRYVVIGVSNGVYGLVLTRADGDQFTQFEGRDIRTRGGAIHQYAVDWDALARGERGVTVEIDQDGDGVFEKTIQAGSEFTGDELEYRITAAAGAGGVIAPSGPVAVMHGTDQTFTITPDSSHVIHDVFVDGSSVLGQVVMDGRVGTYTFVNVRRDHAIHAVFAAVRHEAAVNHGPNPVPAEGCVFWFNLPAGARSVKLLVYNVAGRLVAEVSLDAATTRYPAAGRWRPVDKNGIPFANGPYVYVLIADGKVIGQGKMVIQR